MKKYIRKHLKDEKRILKLMYKKGIFEILRINLKHLGWEYLLYGKRQRRRKGKNKYAFRECLPELHEWTQDYWGEGDSHSVINSFKEHLFWETAKEFDEESGFPVNHKYPKNRFLIEYLTKLPTKNNDSKFNIFLKRNDE
jgi:hypothetical protein